MYLLIIILILFYISIVSDAICDTLKNNFDNSVFNNKKLSLFWWNPTHSYINKWKKIPRYNYYYYDTGILKTWGDILGIKWLKISLGIEQFSDAWHTFKTIRVISNITLISLLVPLPDKVSNSFRLIYFILFGIMWNMVFSGYYNNELTNKSKIKK